MSKAVFGFDCSLLRGSDGRAISFEEARAETYFKCHPRAPSACPVSEELAFPLSDKLNVPPEAPLVIRYARKLMKQDNALFLKNAWGDPFISAEAYVHIRALKTELDLERKNNSSDSNSQEWVNCRRRQAKSLSVSPSAIFDDDGDEMEVGVSAPKQASCDDESPVDDALEDPRLGTPTGANRESQLADLPSAMVGMLRRNDHHFIDVSNYVMENSPVSLTTVATQLFSPSQVRELLLLQMHPTTTTGSPMTASSPEEGVDPWCSKFADVFWTKVATRVGTWSSFYRIQSLKPSRGHVHFGPQEYALEDRLGSGTYGVVFLARLVCSCAGPASAFSSYCPTAPLDTTTLGCWPEQQNALRQAADDGGDGTGCVLRVVKRQVPDNPLEFYYMREARRRVANAFRSGDMIVDVRPAICPALALNYSPLHFTDLLMPFYPVGLLTLLNYGVLPSVRGADRRRRRTAGDRMPLARPAPLGRFDEELVALYLTLELLWLAEGLHKFARMIHGDIKPDNFRINDRLPLVDLSELDEGIDQNDLVSTGLLSGRITKVLVLVDFGLCIDMARFPEDTVFKVDKTTTSKRSFPCIEMLTGHPWTFQLDLFNIAGIIYALVFKRYMKVNYSDGQWKPTFMPRSNRLYRAIDVWQKILTALLNVPSCATEDYPNLQAIRLECELFLWKNAQDYNMAAEKTNTIIAYLTHTGL